MAGKGRSRVPGHALIWMAVVRAQCECGEDFRIRQDESQGRRSSALQDQLMDMHSEHLGWVRGR
jgi:hypothetical protein